MITRIEALNVRSLRYVSRPMGRFHVLVGPNASGKTTFLDVVAFLGQLVASGLDAAVGERTQNFQDLIWGRAGDGFELAIEAAIPAFLRESLREPSYDTVRYEIALGMEPDSREIGFRAERVLLKIRAARESSTRDMFPASITPPSTLLTPLRTKGTQLVLNKVPGGNDNFYSETYSVKGKGWVPAFKLGVRRSALANLPEDESKFPVATWLKGLLTSGIQQMILNSLLIRRASPPGKGRAFEPDGSNLPWVIADLERRHPDRIVQWVAHLQTALPDIEGIRTIERPDDKHRYMMLRYRGGLEVPSWMASDGTLRLPPCVCWH
jgi:predicted ATPase